MAKIPDIVYLGSLFAGVVLTIMKIFGLTELSWLAVLLPIFWWVILSAIMIFSGIAMAIIIVTIEMGMKKNGTKSEHNESSNSTNA